MSCIQIIHFGSDAVRGTCVASEPTSDPTGCTVASETQGDPVEHVGKCTLETQVVGLKPGPPFGVTEDVKTTLANG